MDVISFVWVLEMTSQEITVVQPPPIPLTENDDDSTIVGMEDHTLEDIDRVKEEFNTLVLSDNIDKEHALKIINLQHTMESLFQKHVFERDREINRLAFELRVSKMKQEHDTILKKMNDCEEERKSIVQKAMEDTAEFTRQIDEHVLTINRLQTMVNSASSRRR